MNYYYLIESDKLGTYTLKTIEELTSDANIIFKAKMTKERAEEFLNDFLNEVGSDG